MEFLLKFGPLLMQLMSDPNVRELLGKLGTQNFPTVDPAKAVTAATSLFDTNTTKWVQAALVAFGYAVTVDGIQGAGTKAAVMGFQQKEGLVVDGWAGESTQNKLRDKMAALEPAK